VRPNQTPSADTLLRTYSNESYSPTVPSDYKMPCASDGALTERRRQAFFGYDNLPPDTALQPLRLYVGNSPDNKMHIIANEALSLGNCLPMAAACHEARSHATNFSRSNVQIIDVHFSNDDTPAEDCGVQDDAAALQHGMVQLRTVAMTKTTKLSESYNEPTINLFQFASAAHLVHATTQLFGNTVERLIMNIWANPSDCIDTIYWPHTEPTQGRRRP
jgi:hypothetical protein